MASIAEPGIVEPWPLEVQIDKEKRAIGGGELALADRQLISMGQSARFQAARVFCHRIA